MSTVPFTHHDVMLVPDSARIILRPFFPSKKHLVSGIIKRALELTEEEVASRLDAVYSEFGKRHHDTEVRLLAHYEKAREHMPTRQPLSHKRQQFIGSLFTGEYALESAAVFNPSIVPHPDQNDAPAGGLRFMMSLRTTGEGHISSIGFRAGTIAADGQISIDPTTRFVTTPQIAPDPSYEKKSFITKLHEMGIDDEYVSSVMRLLGEHFTRSDLEKNMKVVLTGTKPITRQLRSTLDHMQWLADSNYEISFSDRIEESERCIFPVSPNESNGIEDARFVRFTDDDGSVIYYGTYTAYNGRDILPQFIETRDFLHFHVRTLNGNAVQNKGMAMFPRRINGNYVMLSRQDEENLFIMFSRIPHYWNDPRIIMRPVETWEFVKVGNCGSPIETEDGWLVMTHGVGPMRKYCVGAILLDLEDPTKIIGRLKQPLLAPKPSERDGYVPNVVYSCGCLLHDRTLILPFAMNDHATTVISMKVDDLLEALKSDEP